MNIFKKHQKAILSALMAISALSTMAIPAFAEGETSAPSGFDDPMLYLFIGCVAVFFTMCAGALVIYLKIRRQRNMREWKMDDGTTKLYEDLDDAKWDAPDTVFLDALEPTAALLLDAQPVEKVYGLDGIIITEGNPNPIQAINSGADPYAYKIGLPETNTVYEDVLTTPLEDEPFVNPDTAEPINTAYTPKVQPLGMITTKTEYNNVPHGYVPGNIHIYEDNVERSTLVDEPVAPKPITREEPILPKAEPLAAYVTKDVPITIVTSNEVGGVVHISASIYENKFAPTVLVDEEKAAAPAEPIMAAVTPKLNPLAFNVAREETPVQVPAVHATIVEDVATSAMVDEVKEEIVEPVIIPEAVTPKVDVLRVRMVRDEEPIEIPAVHATIVEDAATSAMVDEVKEAIIEPVIIPEAQAPKSAPIGYTITREEAPIEIPAVHATIVEDIITDAMVDEVKEEIVEPVIIPEATTPKVDALRVRMVNDEEPVEIPAVQATIVEDILTDAMVDEVKEAIIEPVIIPEAQAPKSAPIGYTIAREEAPIEIPAVHATIVEDIITDAMVDEVKEEIVEPVIIPEATTPKVDALRVRMVNDEAPVEIPAVQATIVEDIFADAMVDEVREEIVEPVIIPEAATPKHAPIGMTTVADEAPVEIPTVQATIVEDIFADAMVDEVREEIVEPVIIPETATPKIDALRVRMVNDEEPIQVPVTEAAIFEAGATTVLEDEIVAPAPVEPVATVVSINEAINPSQEFLFDAEIAEEPTKTVDVAGMVYENTTATVLEDEVVASAPVEPVATVVSINEAINPSQEFLFDAEIAEEPVKTVNVAGMVYENTTATVLEDEVVAPAPVEPVATVVSINEAINPSQEFLFDAEIAEEPTKTVDVAGMVYENTTATVLEDEVVAPAPVEPVATVVSINEAINPSQEFLFDAEIAEEPTKTVDVAGMVYENTTATVLEDEIVAPAPVEPVATVVSINEAINPSQEFLFDAEIAEEPTKTVDVAGMVYENTTATVLEDEIVAPAPVEPVATVVSINEAINPSQEFLFDAEIAEEPTKTVDVAGMVYENTTATVLEDEVVAPAPVEPVATVVSINEAINPSQEFLFDAEIAEAPTKTVDVAGMVYENTTATVLEDEVVAPAPVEPVATVVSINEAINPSQEFLFDAEIAEEPTKTVDVAGMVYENTTATVLEDEVVAPAPVEPVATVVSINEAINPSQEFLFDAEIAEEPTKTVDVAGMVYENTAATVLEDDVTIPVAETTLLVAEEYKDSVIPTQEFLFDDEIAEAPIKTVDVAGMVYENTEKTVLEDEIIPTVEITPEAPEQVVIDEAKTPKSSPINHTVFTEEKIVRTTKGAEIFEKTQHTELEDEHIRGYNTKTEEIYEEPTTRNVFDVVAEEEAKAERTEDNTENAPAEEAHEEVITKTEAVISTDDGVIEVTEETTSEPEAPKADVVPKRASKISTIPMTKDGRVKHEEPMIPTLPHISARGVGPDKNTPFVLPATATGMGMMEKNPAYNEEKSEPSFENALNKANDLPIAPIANRGNEAEPKSEKAEPKKSDVVVANANVSINYDGEDTEVPAIPEELPELIEEPVEEPKEEIVEEPEVTEPEIPEEPETPAEPEIPEEPVATIVEEPVIEEPIVEEEPDVAPVFTDAEKADELMTDEEAEEHIEIIEETPGRERKGKFHAINLDTICDHFEDGEKVTLDDLKAKKLAPQSCGRLKVLARGTMNKKLTIEADSFSLQAVKMITLAGGHSEMYR